MTSIIIIIIFACMRMNKIVTLDHIVTLCTPSTLVATVKKRFQLYVYALFNWFYIAMYQAICCDIFLCTCMSLLDMRTLFFEEHLLPQVYTPKSCKQTLDTFALLLQTK